MSAKAERIETELMSLPRSERARLAEKLIASLGEDPDVLAAWEDEAERRYQLFLTGEMTARPLADVVADARARLKR
ncbi:MAG TPA: addiction module protein [Longimicrobium sp.]|nr:addiction module protein [Longimicrobium sp.]